MANILAPLDEVVTSASYIIYQEGAIIYARNGRTGTVEFSGADASTVINNAISATSIAGGGIVGLKEGNYSITASVVMLDNVVLQGEGWSTILTLAANTNINVITATSQTNLTIRDLKIDGNKANQTILSSGIYFHTVTDINITNVNIFDFLYEGILIRNSSDGIIAHCEISTVDFDAICLWGPVTNFRVNGCYCHDPTGRQTIHSYGSAGNRNTDIEITNCETVGLLLEYTDYATVSNCISHGDSMNGIDIGSVTSCAISNCVCYDNGWSGINVEKNTSVDVAITGCICYGNGTNGISICDGATKVAIVGCICAGNGYSGIKLAPGCNMVTITGCQCRDSVDYDGIEIDACEDVIMTGNVIRDNNRYGVHAYNVSNYNILVGNSLRGNGTAPYSMAGANNEIANNTS